MSDGSDAGPRSRRKRKVRRLEDSPSSSGASDGPVGTTSRRRKSRRLVVTDDSDSDSGSSIEAQHKWRRKVPRVTSDADSDSSGSVVVKRTKRPLRVVSESDNATNDSDRGFEGSSSSQWETDASDGEAPASKDDGQAVANKVQDTGVDSDSSDGQSEKCPICLLSLKTQEIGTPESCDHVFCVECIQEWSKNMNTCPVDRQEYRLILVRAHIDGAIYRRIPVEPPQPQNDVGGIFEDPTFCEICGSGEREDRMLLCDGCDLGFHLECLTPPLEDVPVGAWYCNDCSPSSPEDADGRELVQVRMLLDEAGALGRLGLRRRTTSPRLVPRTRHTERVRRRIENNRSSNRGRPTNPNDDPGAAVSSTTSRRRRKTRRRKKRASYTIVYRVDEATGETVAVKKKRTRPGRKQRRAERTARPKTVKKRLALQLGMCAPRTAAQNIPEVRVPPNCSGNNSVLLQRQQAGIPALHLFGPRDQLDYFSASDDEFDGGGVIFRRAPTRSDAVLLRRRSRAKAVALPNPVSSSSDVLGSILDSQARFHSKNTVLSMDKHGRITVEQGGGSYSQCVRQRPSTYSNSTNRDSVPSSSRSDDYRQTNQGRGEHSNSTPTSTVGPSNPAGHSSAGGSNEQYEAQDYSQRTLCSIYDVSLEDNQKDKQNKDDEDNTRSNTPGSESEIDIYSDIETVSTSKMDEGEPRPPSPLPTFHTPNMGSDDENDSEPDMVIDTEVANHETEAKEETAVTSTVDSNIELASTSHTVTSIAHSTSEIQSEAVQSSNQEYEEKHKEVEDEDSEDECPNFSIYSKESITLAKNTDIALESEMREAQLETNQVGEVSSSPAVEAETSRADAEITANHEMAAPQPRKKSSSGLYSDSEDESVVKKLDTNSFGISDLRNMTEDISEEERSYTPCLDERTPAPAAGGAGLEGLETEMISDEDRNDFDESHELKTASDGDALEINAKESELDFTRPEDYEEGEIIDKGKSKKAEDAGGAKKPKETPGVDGGGKKAAKKKDAVEKETGGNKENDGPNKEASFKKLSKSNKERNYRDKDRSKSRDRKGDKESRKEGRKREKRKEIERYDVRAIIAEKPRRIKDKFGRDIRTSRSKTRTPSPKGSPPRARRSQSKGRPSPPRGRRSVSRSRRSLSKYRNKSPPPEWLRKKRRSKSPAQRKRSRSKGRKRKRSGSRRRNRSAERSKKKQRQQQRSRSRRRSRSPPSPKRVRQEWNHRRNDWSRSMSRTPEARNPSPSWTPPRMENQVQPRNLTVILTNDSNKKKKEKKKKAEKKAKEGERSRKRRRSDRTPPPSKEVFASGDNILVSVSFNKENETRDVSTKRKRAEAEEQARKAKKDRRAKNRLRRNRDLSGIKPVAIIDLERSPFKELTPSPKDVIVLSDSDNDPTNLQKDICDSSQQVASPEICNPAFLTGPKTPPEPQVKFTLALKPPQLRAISNPLHEPDDIEPEVDPEEEEEEVIDQSFDGGHKGPNTPPEPPNSPPSSPDVYDPFEPTKSRSPTPDPLQLQSIQSMSALNLDADNRDDSATETGDVVDKTILPIIQTPDPLKSHTPPLADVQPADSQSSVQATPESNLAKSPERQLIPLISQSVQAQPVSTTKPVAQTIPFSSVPPSIVTSTPVSSNLATSRINILNSTIIAPSSLPRIVLPNAVKSSPVKISPTKPAAKSTPVKPMPSKSGAGKVRKSNSSNRTQQNGGDANDSTNINFDSPYSPGSSDYEDLFEPPADTPAKPSKPTGTNKPTTKSPSKVQNAFDALFGSPFNKIKAKNDKTGKFIKKTAVGSKGKGTKQVGVKIDEDNLKILDELPNSAVEMQVKDKFLKKLNRQERVVEEVKLVLKPHYNKKHISKEEYKDVLRRAVPKICHNKSGEINPTKIKNLIEAYVKKVRHSKKVTSSSSANPQKA